MFEKEKIRFCQQPKLTKNTIKKTGKNLIAAKKCHILIKIMLLKPFFPAIFNSIIYLGRIKAQEQPQVEISHDQFGNINLSGMESKDHTFNINFNGLSTLFGGMNGCGQNRSDHSNPDSFVGECGNNTASNNLKPYNINLNYEDLFNNLTQNYNGLVARYQNLNEKYEHLSKKMDDTNQLVSRKILYNQNGTEGYLNHTKNFMEKMDQKMDDVLAMMRDFMKAEHNEESVIEATVPTVTMNSKFQNGTVTTMGYPIVTTKGSPLDPFVATTQDTTQMTSEELIAEYEILFTDPPLELIQSLSSLTAKLNSNQERDIQRVIKFHNQCIVRTLDKCVMKKDKSVKNAVTKIMVNENKRNFIIEGINKKLSYDAPEKDLTNYWQAWSSGIDDFSQADRDVLSENCFSPDDRSYKMGLLWLNRGREKGVRHYPVTVESCLKWYEDFFEPTAMEFAKKMYALLPISQVHGSDD